MENTNKRPNYHINSWQNWLNDPNGLIYYNNEYHAFYQHYPYEHKWGPMHWGHVVSKDLYRWEHKAIALYPDKNGYCFSGSAILDKDNVSGLGSKENPPLLLFYTNDMHHNGEEQCLAYSLDGSEFIKYDKNPIIPSNGRIDFRDPKVFYYKKDKSYKMVLSVKDHVEIYSSNNLIDWKHVSNFGPLNYTYPGVWECPDLFPIEYKGKEYWVLILSIGSKIELGNTITQYFVGEFDGTEFIDTYTEKEPHLIDEGFDNYASVSFAHTEENILLGWALDGLYGPDTPDYGYCGQLTSPRIPFLYEKAEKLTHDSYEQSENSDNPLISENYLYLGFRPYPLPNDIKRESLELSIDENKKLGKFSKETLILEFELEADEEFDFELFNTKGELVSLSKVGNTISLNREKAIAEIKNEHLQKEIYQKRLVKSRDNSKSKYFIFFDRPLLEVYAEDGRIIFTATIYPSEDLNEFSISENIECKVYSLEEYQAPMLEDPFKYKSEDLDE